MKNLFSKVHFGALAFIFALGLIITQSAFTPKTAAPNYYKDASNQWQPIGSLVEGTTAGTYRCDDEQPEVICKGYFDHTNPQPSENPTSDVSYGRFTLN